VVGAAVPGNHVHERALPLAHRATSETGARSRIVDRTLLCATQPDGGIHKVEVRAHQGIREGRSNWKQLPFAVVGTGGGTSGIEPGPRENPLAWITAGRPSAATTIDSEWRVVLARATGTVGMKGTCRSTAKHVPLTFRGLRGDPASPFGDEIDCVAPRRVLVRVRAVLESPAAPGLRRSYLRTSVPTREASLAVRTERGRLLVYAAVSANGKAHVFTAKGCIPE
jgi:hypothetical protein